MNWLSVAPWLLSLALGIGGLTAYEIERGNYQEAKAALADQQKQDALDLTAAESIIPQPRRPRP